MVCVCVCICVSASVVVCCILGKVFSLHVQYKGSK